MAFSVVSCWSASKQLRFELAIAARVVGAVLGFAVVEAVGAAADGQDRRCLDALGDCHAAEEIPPAFQIRDEIGSRREVLGDEAWRTAEVFFDGASCIPFEDVLGRSFFPALDE